MHRVEEPCWAKLVVYKYKAKRRLSGGGVEVGRLGQSTWGEQTVYGRTAGE